MTRYIVQRLILLIPVLLGILFVTFTLMRLIPGDPARIALGEKATDAVVESYRRRMGLDQPIPVQFVRYLGTMAKGDFGVSSRTGQPVTTALKERLPMTIELTFIALLLSVGVGIGAGILSAVRHNSLADLTTMFLTNIGISMPIFWLGLLLAYFFAFWLKWLPPSGRFSVELDLQTIAEAWNLQRFEGTRAAFLLPLADVLSQFYLLRSLLTGNMPAFVDTLKHLFLPAFALSTISMAYIARLTRSSLLEVLNQDYIRTARAKGLRERLILFRHAMKNAMLPIVTIVGLQVGGLLSGAPLTESVFALPGLGRYAVEAVLARDYPVVQATVVVIASIYVFVNLIVDVMYVWLDPRIRYD